MLKIVSKIEILSESKFLTFEKAYKVLKREIGPKSEIFKDNIVDIRSFFQKFVISSPLEEKNQPFSLPRKSCYVTKVLKHFTKVFRYNLNSFSLKSPTAFTLKKFFDS